MQVEIRVHRKFSGCVPRARLIRTARRTLRAERAKAALAIYVTGDAEIRALNHRFHATDAPTDVLSFPAERPAPPRRIAAKRGQHPLRDGAKRHPHLGDIVVSYERARVQAHAAHWRIADELDLLTVHGILHLLGYDDRTPRARARMWKRQAEILGHAIQEIR